MRVWKFVNLALIFVLISVFSAAQNNAPAAQTGPSIKHVPITKTSPTSGKEMFESYCAVCHGKDAKGGGPAASALKVSPPDLTQLANKNSGKYPAAHVSAVISGQADLASHGNQEMPVWGPLFSSMSSGHRDQVQQRVSNLSKYIESLQQK